ncbi:hypothetical protein D3C80_1818650 [compost metagenome]
MARPPRRKALVAVVPPFNVSTTRMPLPVVNAPRPNTPLASLALRMSNAVLPAVSGVAVPPSITSLSEGEPSPSRNVWSAMTPSPL